MLVLAILLGALATEATVKVLLRGSVFESPRNWIYSKISEQRFFGKLIRCPYCLSFWVSLFLLLLALTLPSCFLVYTAWMSICRLSNIIHDISDKIYYTQYGTGVSPDSK